MVATRCPTFFRATATCMAVVDLPDPPFSLPMTTTCADADLGVFASASMTPPYVGSLPSPRRLSLQTIEL